MHPRAQELIERLDLQPHPEGGFYCETFRSGSRVTGPEGERDGLTAIFFLLTEGRHSRWHRVAADELWTFVEGDGVELFDLELQSEELRQALLGPFDAGREPLHVVPAGHWQAARAQGPYALVACAVAPGFEFSDFTLLRERPLEARRLRARFPELAELL